MGTKKCEQCKKADAVTCVSCSTKKSTVILNHVLAYIATYIKRSSVIQLKLAVIGYYDEGDITMAKTELISSLQDFSMDLQNESVTRQNSPARSAKEATVDDIISIFQKMDVSDDEMPKFYVEDVSKLPPASPEAGGSLMTLVEAMAAMRGEMQVMQETVTALQATVNTHDAKIQHCARPTTNRGTFAEAAATIRDSWRPESLSMGIAPFPSAGGSAGPQNRGSRPGSRSGTPHRPRDGSSVDDQFTVISGNGGKRPFKGSNPNNNGQSAGNKPKQQHGKAGTAKSGTFKVGPQSFQMQLTNVHPDMDAEAIKEYIRERDPTIKATNIEDKSSDGWETKRYLLTFDAQFYEKVLCSDFWPNKIYYKQWFAPREKNKRTL